MGRRVGSGILLAVLLPLAAAADWPAPSTHLRDAIRNNRSAELELVLEHPGLTETTAEDGKTVLMAAAADGNTKLLTALLDRGADPLAGNHRGGTALMYAAANDAGDCARVLLERGAAVNARAENGWTAITLANSLHVAMEQGHCEIARALAGAGLDPDKPDFSLHTPRSLAIRAARCLPR